MIATFFAGKPQGLDQRLEPDPKAGGRLASGQSVVNRTDPPARIAIEWQEAVLLGLAVEEHHRESSLGGGHGAFPCSKSQRQRGQRGARRQARRSPAPRRPGEQPLDARTDVARALRIAFKLGGSLIATWGVSLAGRLVLPRSLGPAGFGIYNFADAFSTTCFIALTLGVDPYIHKEIPVRLGHASDFIGGVFVLRLSGGVLVGLVMWGILVISHRTAEVQEVVLLFAAMQLFSLNNDSLAALLHAANRIDGLTVANIVTKLVWGGLLIWLAVTPGRAPRDCGRTLGVEVLRAGWLWLLARWSLGLRWRLEIGGAVAVLLASMPFFVNTIAHTAYGRVDATMLAFLSSDIEVGYYGAASNLGALTLVLTPLIGWVLLPLTARAAARSRDELIALMRNALRVILSLAIPIALAIWLGATDLIRLAFGVPFLPSVSTLQILAPLFVVTYVAIVASTCLIRLDRAWTVTTISLGGLVITPLLNLALVRPAWAAFGPGGAGGGAAAALLVTEISVSTAMLVCLRGQILSRENLRSLAAEPWAAPPAVVVLDHFLRLCSGPGATRWTAWSTWRSRSCSGALRPARELWRRSRPRASAAGELGLTALAGTRCPLAGGRAANLTLEGSVRDEVRTGTAVALGGGTDATGLEDALTPNLEGGWKTARIA